MYKILILPIAEDDLVWLRKNDKSSYLKCFDLIREIATFPHSGIGKPERLKHFDKEVYSRRLNHKDRIIYTIYESIKEIDISSCRGHYEYIIYSTLHHSIPKRQPDNLLLEEARM